MHTQLVDPFVFTSQQVITVKCLRCYKMSLHTRLLIYIKALCIQILNNGQIIQKQNTVCFNLHYLSSCHLPLEK